MIIALGALGAALFLTFIIVTVASAHRRRLAASAGQPVVWLDRGNNEPPESLLIGEQIWLSKSLTEKPRAEELAASRARTVETLSDLVAATANQLSESDRADAARRADRLREVREQRQDLKVVLPALSKAMYAAAPTMDLVLGQLLTSGALHGAGHVVQDLLDAHLGSIQDGLIDAAGAGGHHALQAVADTHIPIFTIASSAKRYHSAYSHGLDSATAITNGAIDAGSRASGAMIGAHALGTFVPVVGHLVGAALGGLVGGMIGSQIIQQPFKIAYANLETALEQAGNEVSVDAWQSLVEQDGTVVGARQACLEVFITEVEAACPQTIRRRFWPSITDIALRDAIVAGKNELSAEWKEVYELEELLEKVSDDPKARTQIAAMAIVRPGAAEDLGIEAASIAAVHAALTEVQSERERLVLQRG